MQLELVNYFKEKRASKNSYGGYDFKVEGINFSLVEMPMGLSLEYFYVGKGKSVAPTNIILDADIDRNRFFTKIIDIINKVKN